MEAGLRRGRRMNEREVASRMNENQRGWIKVGKARKRNVDANKEGKVG